MVNILPKCESVDFPEILKVRMLRPFKQFQHRVYSVEDKENAEELCSKNWNHVNSISVKRFQQVLIQRFR